MTTETSRPAIVYGTRDGAWVTYRVTLLGKQIEYRGIYNESEDPASERWMNIELETLRRRLHALINANCNVQKAMFAARVRGASPAYIQAMYGA